MSGYLLAISLLSPLKDDTDLLTVMNQLSGPGGDLCNSIERFHPTSTYVFLQLCYGRQK